MTNSYLITWNKGYGESGTHSVSSTEELLDFFDTRVRSEAAQYTFTNSDDVDDYEVYALAGSTNPLEDIYQIVEFANSRQPGTVIEGVPLPTAPRLWFAEFRVKSIILYSFGSEPLSAVTKLLSTWIDISSKDAEIDPQLFHDHRAELTVKQVSVDTVYGKLGATGEYDFGAQQALKGDDPTFDDIFQALSPSAAPLRF
jgi:hypothetical protein